MKCWVCNQPAVWTVTAQKAGPPEVLVEFHACERCIPFALENPPKENVHEVTA